MKQKMSIYIPFNKEDAVDIKLAEYINNYPDRQKLKIMFMRESEGVYLFGSRRVAVKVDKEKINSKCIRIMIFIYSTCWRWISFN